MYLRIVLFFGLCLLPNLATSALAPLPPVSAFGTTPALSNITLSPDGKLLASASNTGQVSIIILDREAKKISHKISFDQTLKIRGLSFINETTLIATFSLTFASQGDAEEKSEIGAIFAINTLDGSSKQLLDFKTNNGISPSSGSIVSRHGQRSGEILMSARLTSASTIGGATDTSIGVLLSVNTTNGKWRIVERGIRESSAWFVDKDGKLQARIDNYYKPSREVLRVRRGNEWVNVYENKDTEFDIIGLSADSQSALAIGARGGERKRLWSIAFTDGVVQPLYMDAEYDVEGTVRDPYDRRLLGVRIGGLEQKTFWLDNTAEARINSVASALPGRRIEITGYSRDGRYVLTNAENRSFPGVFYLIDFQNNRAELVGQEYPQLAKVQIGDSKPYYYKARDGYKIPSYLTLPPGLESKNLPMVVLPHGGPRARDSGPNFDWWSQFIASRGYVVLQPQFRGSTGFGYAHERAGYRQWGQRMQDDVTDGVKDLISQGIVDPGRVCIVGASYGGYAALAGAAFTPELYKCAVSVAGVFDLVEMLRWQEDRYGLESASVKFWREHIGKPSDLDVIAFSPSNGASKISASVLLIHGVDDTVVPFRQSEFMANALKSSNKPFELYKLKAEDHWLSRSPSRIEMLEQVERFLKEKIGPIGRVTIEMN